MNWLQKATLILGGVLVLANVAFPPWMVVDIRTNGQTIAEYSAGRKFVASRPTLQTLESYYPDGRSGGRYGHEEAYVDWSLLGLTSLVIVLGDGLLFGLVTFLKKPKPN